MRQKMLLLLFVFALAGVFIGNDVFAGKMTKVEDFKTLENSKQVILVTTEGYNTHKAKIETFEKIQGKWKKILTVSGAIGKDGFAKSKKEGDMKSPRGKYTLGTAFGRFPNPNTKMNYRNITDKDVWVDDSKSPYYNTWQQKPANGRWTSAEDMDIAPYDYGFVINYNTKERVPYKGSGIFFHVVGESGYTAGCTATSKENVLKILKWLDPKKQPVIIQAPKNELGKY